MKKVNLYMNTGSLLKFAKLLDFRRCDYINKVYTLDHEQTYKLNNGTELTVLPAYHDELITKDYAVGIKLEFNYDKQGKNKKRILITSDTGLFPHKKDKAENDIPVLNTREIWKTYQVKPGQVNLLITHIGSVKEQEITTSYEKALAESLYPNHLGIIGTCRVISALKPRLALVSEWGEELKNIRQDITGIIADVVLKNTSNPQPKVLPASTAFIYNIKTEEIYCIRHKLMEKFDSIQYEETGGQTCTYFQQNEKEFYFFCNKNLTETEKCYMSDGITSFKKRFKDHKLIDKEEL